MSVVSFQRCAALFQQKMPRGASTGQNGLLRCDFLR